MKEKYQNAKYIIELIIFNSFVTTMIGPSQGRGTAKFLMPNCTMINVTEALYALRANRTLLKFQRYLCQWLSFGTSL